MEVSSTKSVFLRFNYGSSLRTGFSAEQRYLIAERGRIWSLLTKHSNDHIKNLVKSLVMSSPALIAIQQKLKDDPSRQNRISWRLVVNSFRPAIKAEDASLNQVIAEVLGESGIWWQNRDTLYADFVRALRTNKNFLVPIRSRQAQDMCGNFNYRFQKPVTIDDIESGNLPVQIIRSGSHAVIKMPIHSDGSGQYRMAEWPFTWHRDLPAGCRVRSLTVIGRLDGDQWRLSVSFLLEEQVTLRHVPHANLCGVDVGWRLSLDGLMVATSIVIEKVISLSLPMKWVNAMDYVLSLDEILEDSAKTAWLDSSIPHAFPGWIRAITVLSQIELPHAQLWIKATASMRSERKNKIARLERQRLDSYRNYAANLVKIAGSVVVEKLDLRRLLAGDSKQGPQQKRQQRYAAVSILQDCIEHACNRAGTGFRHVEAYQTTTKHIECGFLNKPSQDQVVVCKGCGERYDQDVNAARNIAASTKYK